MPQRLKYILFHSIVFVTFITIIIVGCSGEDNMRGSPSHIDTLLSKDIFMGIDGYVDVVDGNYVDYSDNYQGKYSFSESVKIVEQDKFYDSLSLEKDKIIEIISDTKELCNGDSGFLATGKGYSTKPIVNDFHVDNSRGLMLTRIYLDKYFDYRNTTKKSRASRVIQSCIISKLPSLSRNITKSVNIDKIAYNLYYQVHDGEGSVMFGDVEMMTVIFDAKDIAEFASQNITSKEIEKRATVYITPPDMDPPNYILLSK
jgi:hypothetical protein